ncbi:unnamed protein product [Dovyalis caffra]|uniref:Uncharacterized protein n=1 Tax=Dovyalis caffra TaxID=77055 RepID=A0AAV1S143_9ROSI|nr:unnamed protein product [Dovyalis caffra]
MEKFVAVTMHSRELEVLTELERTLRTLRANADLDHETRKKRAITKKSQRIMIQAPIPDEESTKELTDCNAIQVNVM